MIRLLEAARDNPGKLAIVAWGLTTLVFYLVECIK